MDLQYNSISNLPSFTNTTENFILNPLVLIVIAFVIIIYYVLFVSLGNKGSGVSATSVLRDVSTPSGKGFLFLEIVLWSFFIILIIINGAMYFFNYNIVAKIKGLFTGEPDIEISVDNKDIPKDTTVPEIMYEKQVFHVPNNKYTYDDAKAICKAYGAKLANWEEMYKAYEKGADWCGYGWSDNQMALFPTQYDKWQHLQTIKGHENDCGRPGVNGGYIANPNVKFGVNCYGHKPVMTDEEMQQMSMTPKYPLTQKDIDFQNKVEYWKEQLPSMDVSPFNDNQWSMSLL